MTKINQTPNFTGVNKTPTGVDKTKKSSQGHYRRDLRSDTKKNAEIYNRIDFRNDDALSDDEISEIFKSSPVLVGSLPYKICPEEKKSSSDALALVAEEVKFTCQGQSSESGSSSYASESQESWSDILASSPSTSSSSGEGNSNSKNNTNAPKRKDQYLKRQSNFVSGLNIDW